MNCCSHCDLTERVESHFKPFVTSEPTVKCKSCGWKGVALQTHLHPNWLRAKEPEELCPNCGKNAITSL